MFFFFNCVHLWQHHLTARFPTSFLFLHYDKSGKLHQITSRLSAFLTAREYMESSYVLVMIYDQVECRINETILFPLSPPPSSSSVSLEFLAQWGISSQFSNPSLKCREEGKVQLAHPSYVYPSRVYVVILLCKVCLASWAPWWVPLINLFCHNECYNPAVSISRHLLLL